MSTSNVTSIVGVETLLTPAEVMAHLRIGKTALYQLIKDGKLRATKYNRKTFFRASTIQAFIEACEQPAPETAKLVRDL